MPNAGEYGGAIGLAALDQFLMPTTPLLTAVGSNDMLLNLAVLGTDLLFPGMTRSSYMMHDIIHGGALYAAGALTAHFMGRLTPTTTTTTTTTTPTQAYVPYPAVSYQVAPQMAPVVSAGRPMAVLEI